MDKRRLRRAVLLAILLFALFLIIRGCAPRPISDLRLSSITRVPASAAPLANDLREAMSNRGESVWKVSLVGNADWINQVKWHELNSYPTVVRCDQRDFGVLALGPYVGQIPVTPYEKRLADYHPPSSRIPYYVYLPETGRYISQSDPNASMPPYNLSRGHTSLCLRIAGGSMIGAYARSNEVRLELGKAG